MSTQIQRPSEDATQAGVFPVVEPGHTFATITEKISAIVVRRGTPLWWLAGFLMAFGIMNVMLMAIGWLFYKGTGIWGVNIPVGWGFAIINFVWWIGIGHAGTLISAILFLLKQSWRNSINRFAEAMTLFAVMCAGLFPLIHTGRPWLAAYWLFPLPLTMGVWPQFRSPLIWDVFAVSTYFTVSLLFWFVGLVPDLASLRDHAPKKWQRTVYGMLAMGWIVAYGYMYEAFTAWYSGNPYEFFMLNNRLMGPYRYWYWALISCNIIIPQVFWSKKVRTSIPWLFLVSCVILIGMWLERFIIVIVSLHRDFVPSSWGHYTATRYDWTIFIGTLGMFSFFFLLFLRFLPAISIAEMKALLPESKVQEAEVHV